MKAQTGHRRSPSWTGPMRGFLKPLLIGFWLCLIVLVMLSGSGDAQDQRKSSTFRLTAEAGRWNGAGLRDLPRGTSVSVEATADGRVSFLLLDEPGFNAFPTGGVPLLENSETASVDFSLTIPEAGDYFLIVDNRNGLEARTAVIRVTATAPGATSADEYDRSANQMLSLISDALNRVFRLDGLDLRMERCGDTRYFADGDDIVVCTEYAMALLKTLPDTGVGSPTMMFSIFQRLAERLTGNRVLSDEEMDELAAASMVFLGYRGHVETVASFFAEPGNAETLQSQVTGAERYYLTPVRARLLAEKLSDRELLVRWQETILSNLHTAMLERLRSEPPEWLSAQELDAALAERAAE